VKKVPSGIVPLIAVDRRNSKPLHRQICDAFRAAIVDRRLHSGQRIPSSRVLASELGVSRFPVLNAYAQLLAEGYIEGRAGAGTVVSRSLPDQHFARGPHAPRQSAPKSGPRQVSRRSSILRPVRPMLPWLQVRGAFAAGHGAIDQFPIHIWSRLTARHRRRMQVGALSYGDPMGSMDLRECIATYLRTARAVRCEAQQIMIVSGSQQALAISAQVLVDSGDAVWTEDPGYRFARDAFAMAGCRVVPVPVDNEGMIVATGISLHPKAKAALVTPSHQYPLGVTMSAARRLQLLEWARTSGSWILEDDYDSEYRYEGSPIASLQGLDSDSRVLYIGTFSKVAFPALRLAYMVIPPDLVDRFLAVRVNMDIAPPGFHQPVLADFIREGHFARHIRRMRTLYSKRRTALVDAIRSEFGLQLQILGDAAGMHLVVTLPAGLRDREIAGRAARHDLWVVPLSGAYIGKGSRQGLILGFGNTSEDETLGAVRKLKSFCFLDKKWKASI
jgi:GntR family transcriptional regulator/MocR family aminotransferase